MPGTLKRSNWNIPPEMYKDQMMRSVSQLPLLRSQIILDRWDLPVFPRLIRRLNKEATPSWTSILNIGQDSGQLKCLQSDSLFFRKGSCPRGKQTNEQKNPPIVVRNERWGQCFLTRSGALRETEGELGHLETALRPFCHKGCRHVQNGKFVCFSPQSGESENTRNRMEENSLDHINA